MSELNEYNEQQNTDNHQLISTSPNFRTDLAKKLEELVPEAIADGKVDVVKLKELLAEDAGEPNERFGLFWPGKKQALRAAQEPTTATLRPAKDESKDWDTTNNIFIEGDNLEVLKVLQKQYHNSIKMIYIDPPYNTGKDFVYPDNFKEGLQNYLEFSQQVDEGNKKISTNTETTGRYHSNWLNMMYPRLKLARNLLTDDGVIFISIDDNEQAQLRKLCDEIFGESNFISQLVWLKKNAQNDADNIQKNHEYIIVYARDTNKLAIGKSFTEKKEIFQDNQGFYYIGAGLTTGGAGGTLNARPNLGYTIYYNPSTKSVMAVDDYDKEKARISNDENEVYQTRTDLVAQGYKIIRAPKKGAGLGRWTWALDKFNKEKTKITIRETKNGYAVNKKEYLDSATDIINDGDKMYAIIKKESPFNSVIDHVSSGSGTKELMNLFNGKIFDNPKSVVLLKDYLQNILSNDGIILDFFAGSATTAHAVMQLNAEDGGNRKHIMVQLPEPTDEKSEAFKAGYKKISDIARERINRAGEKIKVDFADKLAERETPLDVGYRTYKLADTNFTKWQSAPTGDLTELQARLDLMRESSNDNASEEDLLVEVLLKMGLPLTTRTQTVDVDGLHVYQVVAEGDSTEGQPVLYLNEHAKPTLEQLRAIITDLTPSKFVILDDAFQGDNQLKTNLVQTCKSYDVELWTV